MARYNIRTTTTRSWPKSTNHQLTQRATGIGTAQAPDPRPPRPPRSRQAATPTPARYSARSPKAAAPPSPPAAPAAPHQPPGPDAAPPRNDPPRFDNPLPFTMRKPLPTLFTTPERPDRPAGSSGMG